MESNGKRVTTSGEPLDYFVGEVDFGEPGTTGQHSFFQLMHMGQVALALPLPPTPNPNPKPNRHQAANERATREAREKQGLQRALDAANTALP